VDKLQFNTLATLRFSGVSSSVVETAELSGGAMMIDISLAQNDVDNFKWVGPWSDFTLKFSDKPGMIFDSLSVVSWSCNPASDLLGPVELDVVPVEYLAMKEPTHWIKSPKLPSNSPSFKVSGVAERASAMTAVQSERFSSLKLNGFDLREFA